ncbi:hypothetical protein FOG18_00595 [Legionella israelensis]|uniref:hypothetical protein n=1 Tax=Legionella israelensis TaxID=454 RepID=UPI0011816B09|nr:hypothetical protein [Legionella israelensis]QDP71185.1 hypothetical protein FOG18_00595 [Legionella israelensis]
MSDLSNGGFIQALRQGNYLLFLQWPDFISKRYKVYDADSLVDLLIFHWIQEEFGDEDIKAAAIMNAIIYDENCLLENEQINAGVNLIVAACQCQVFKKNDLIKHYSVDREMDKEDILEFMKTNTHRLSDKENCKQLLLQNQHLNLLAKKYHKEIALFREQRQALYLIDGYMNAVEEDDSITVKNKAMRKGLINSLRKALDMHGPKLEEMQETIQHYFNQLRCFDNLQPWEEEYFTAMVSQHWSRRLLIWSTRFASTFFNHVLIADKHPLDSKSENEETSSSRHSI